MDLRNRNRTCCFTGHRPERLHSRKHDVKVWLAEQILTAYNEGYTIFITGMQRGVDLWAAEIVLKLKEDHPEIQLIGASAFPHMEDGWTEAWIDTYNNVKNKCDEHYFVRKIPSRQSFFARNHWMVDRSSRVIAVYEGEPGGTKKTIEYAISQDVSVVSMK